MLFGKIGITYAAGKFIQARLNLDIVWQNRYYKLPNNIRVAQDLSGEFILAKQYSPGAGVLDPLTKN
jgi:hypothetical protein